MSPNANPPHPPAFPGLAAVVACVSVLLVGSCALADSRPDPQPGTRGAGAEPATTVTTAPVPVTAPPARLMEPSSAVEAPSSESEESGMMEPATAGRPCDESTRLTLAPLAPEDYGVILPLGNLNPPGHTIPTDHIYYMLPREGEGTREVEVRAPGHIVVLRVDSTAQLRGGREVLTDFSLTFSPCDDRILTFGHLTSLDAELMSAVESPQDRFCHEYGDGEVTYRQCSVPARVELGAGSVVGTAGGLEEGSAALDLWAFDLEVEPLAWANPDRYPSDRGLLHRVVCPLDLFAADARIAQMARLGGHSGKPRTIEPVCGVVNQDVPGTAQGNWFTGDRTTMHGPWDHHLALVHDNVDPTLAAISIGGVVSSPAVWLFRPEDAGAVNRRFVDVTSDGTTYCYDSLDSSGSSAKLLEGRFLIEMADDETLLVEHQDGICRGEEPAFGAPVTYER